MSSYFQIQFCGTEFKWMGLILRDLDCETPCHGKNKCSHENSDVL